MFIVASPNYGLIMISGSGRMFGLSRNSSGVELAEPSGLTVVVHSKENGNPSGLE